MIKQNRGRWFYTNNQYDADYTVFVTKDIYDADRIVFVTSNKYEVKMGL